MHNVTPQGIVIKFIRMGLSHWSGFRAIILDSKKKQNGSLTLGSYLDIGNNQNCSAHKDTPKLSGLVLLGAHFEIQYPELSFHRKTHTNCDLCSQNVSSSFWVESKINKDKGFIDKGFKIQGSGVCVEKHPYELQGSQVDWSGCIKIEDSVDTYSSCVSQSIQPGAFFIFRSLMNSKD